MNRRNLQVFVVFGVLVGITTGILARARSNYNLGAPGVKVANIPMYVVYEKQTNILAPISVPLPENPLDYISEALPVASIEVQMLPPDTVYGRRLYTASDGFRAMISVVLMGTDRTSIHKPQYCLSGMGESIVKTEVITVPMKKPHPYDLQVMKLTTTKDTRAGGRVTPRSGLYLYWFVADGQLTPDHGERMWLMGKDLVTKGLLQRWAYIAFWGVCNPGQEEMLLSRMTQLMVETVPDFQLAAGAEIPNSVAMTEVSPRETSD